MKNKNEKDEVVEEKFEVKEVEGKRRWWRRSLRWRSR